MMMKPYGKGCGNTDVLFTLDELDGRRAIGQGASAVVYVGAWRGLDVAVKVFRGGLGQRAEDEAERERAVHRRLRHPNIVGMLGEALVKCSHALVFEYCPRALDVVSMGGWRSQGSTLAKLRLLDIALGVGRALEHAHLRGVMHRDVKPSQILLSSCGAAKLADWGLACRVGTAECAIGETGTWEYMAPEVVTYGVPFKKTKEIKETEETTEAKVTMGQYGTAADVYSYAVTLWCILAGEAYPYSAEYITAEQAAICAARGTLRPRRLKRLHDTPELHDLLAACWAQHPADRPTMTQVVDELLHIRAEVELRCNESVQTWWSPWFW